MGNHLVTDVSDVISTFVYRVGLRSGRIFHRNCSGFFQSVVGMIFLNQLYCIKLGTRYGSC